MMALVGREATSLLYWLLKVAVPQIRGGRMVERGGWVCGILSSLLRNALESVGEAVSVLCEDLELGMWSRTFALWDMGREEGRAIAW